ncbi:MAG: class I SAM-dependent methyltransferase [Ardenticatenales bacterium]|nr:class I SAM-dependent methyltransferase [Ardenticatenales bacterium]
MTMIDYDNAWRRWMSDYNEGLGLVYERLILNDFLEERMRQHNIRTVLEAPIYGMAGASGINSVRFAQLGAHVTLVDVNDERLREVRRLWGELGLLDRVTFVCTPDPSRLPFPAEQFDLVWNWAALWHLPDAAATLREMARVSKNLIFTAMPNKMQVGYLLRKYLLEREFFDWIQDERWSNVGVARKVLEERGLTLVEQGVLDVPPWPDTVMPASEVLKRLGLGERFQSRFEGDSWEWSTMAYYTGDKPELKAQMDGYAFLERATLPWQLKMVWAHHRYILLQKPRG